jgi:dTDP-glucose 4,6-dehydratase/UDP-glucose 4-epimerase
MKILIIGSEGFIGSHAAHYFEQKRHNVYKVDFLNKTASNYISIDQKMLDYNLLFEKQFDVCINASGTSSVQLSLGDPAVDFIGNAASVFLILNSIRKKNPTCKFIHLSSAAVYGNPLQLPVSEDAPITPISPYGYHKFFGELICKEFFTLYGIGTINLRVFSTYGEGLRKQLFWDIFIKTRNTQKLEMYGTGCETRDFIYIEDLIRLFDCVIANADFQGESINVASGVETTINYAVNTLIKYLGWSGGVEFNQINRAGDPKNWRADLSRVTKMGFKSKYSFEDGVKNMAQWLLAL